jgi:hypothetical protein
VLSEKEITIEITRATVGLATAYGCDLTYDYVKIIGDYRTEPDIVHEKHSCEDTKWVLISRSGRK